MGLATQALGVVDHALEAASARMANASRVAKFLKGRMIFEAREDDIYVASYPRSGTTWTQHIVHLLASGGDTDFEHISHVAPWWERSLAWRGDAPKHFANLASPRVFKTHLPYRWLPPQGRLIYIQRRGEDVAASYYRLYCTHLGYRDGFDSFFARFLKGQLQYGSWFKHVAAWQAQRANPRVILLDYEVLREDLRTNVERIASFCNFELSDALLHTILTRCALEAMKKQHTKFDHVGEIAFQRGIDANAFIGQGRVGSGHEKLSADQQREFANNHQRQPKGDEHVWRLADFLY